MVAGKVLPYSMRSRPWESVGGEWMGIPTVLVVMMGDSRIGVHIDTGIDAMPWTQPSSREWVQMHPLQLWWWYWSGELGPLGCEKVMGVMKVGVSQIVNGGCLPLGISVGSAFKACEHVLTCAAEPCGLGYGTLSTYSDSKKCPDVFMICK